MILNIKESNKVSEMKFIVLSYYQLLFVTNGIYKLKATQKNCFSNGYIGFIFIY